MAGRAATTKIHPGDFALSVGLPRDFEPPRGWKWIPLNHLAEMATGHTPDRDEPSYWNGGVKWMCASDARFQHGGVVIETRETISQAGLDNSAAVLLPSDTVCLARTGASIGYAVRTGEPMATNQGFVNWVCGPNLLPKFLQYALVAEIAFLERIAYGAAHHTIYFPELKALHICVPPLPEQRRIVGILDEAFAAIATAKANTETNLRNARAVFESELQAVFSRCGGETAFSEVCDISASLVDPREKEFIDLPHVGGANIETKTGVLIDLKTAREEGLKSGKFVFDDSMVLYSKIRPYLMKAARPDFRGLCSADIYPLAPKPGALDRDYLFHLLLSPAFTAYAIRGSARAGMPKVNREHLFAYRVSLPPVATQRRQAAKLDELSRETQRLAALYQQKLAALDALKKSLLHQAFSGQLTANEPATVFDTKPILTFPIDIEGISPTDLHAGILAMAYRLHDEAGKSAEFTHVKAEKIAHMVEARLGINLGRSPVRDAAGPNDFPRLKKVEHRAKMANWFDFHRSATDGPYRVKMLSGFDRHIEKTRAKLADRVADVEGLLRWMLPMKVRQAEIVATVFAAWNDLLLDGHSPSDAEIVKAAREDWHPDKLRIEQDRFFRAIEWLRKEGVTPKGVGRAVRKRSEG